MGPEDSTITDPSIPTETAEEPTKEVKPAEPEKQLTPEQQEILLDLVDRAKDAFKANRESRLKYLEFCEQLNEILAGYTPKQRRECKLLRRFSGNTGTLNVEEADESLTFDMDGGKVAKFIIKMFYRRLEFLSPMNSAP